MGIPAHVIHIPAGLAIDESTQAEILDVGQANTSNINVRSYGRGSLGKRLGFDAMPLDRLDATSRSAGHRMGMHGDIPFVIDGTYLDAYSVACGVSIPAGRVPEAAVSLRPTSSYSADPDFGALLDCCVVGNYIVYAHETTEAASLGTGSLVLTVEDVVSGATMRAPELMFTADPVSFGTVVCGLASYSTFAIAIFFDDQVGTMYAKYLDTATAATITTGWVDIGANIGFDHVAAGTGAESLSTQSLTNRIAYAYVNSSGGTSQVTVRTLDITGVVETLTINTSSVTPNTVGLHGSIDNTIWVAWDENTLLRLRGLEATVSPSSLATIATTATILTLASGSPSVIGIASSSSFGVGRIVVNDGGSSGRLHMRGFQITAGATAANGAQVTVPNAFIAGRPFRVGDRYCGLFAPAPGNTNNVQRACVLCDFTEDQTWLRPVANLAPNLATMALQAHVERVGSNRYATPIMIATSGTSRSTVLVTFDFAERGRWQTVSHNGATFLSGGLLSYFDGVRVAENGFVVRPPKPTTTNAGTGITGSFRYVLVYEEVDANGNWCASSISDPSAVATVTNKTITVTLRPLSITSRQRRSGGGEVRMSLYRTDVGGEPPYYRLASLPNDTGNATTTYADAIADVTANGQLYSPTLPGSGSSQDHRAPPFCQAISQLNGMLVVASGPDLWWSGQTVSGEGTWFNPAFAVPVEGPAAIVALAAQDGTLYVFKRRSIYSIAGEAPSDNGSQGGLGTPRRMACDVGCIDPASICITSAGIFFQSERGIELLTRAGAVIWIGEKIQGTTAAYPVVSSAVLDDVNPGYVRISLAESESAGLVTGDGRTIVFDLSMNVWISVDDQRGSSASEPTQSACKAYINGAWRYSWLGADGVVHFEKQAADSDAYLDGTSWITAQYELPGLKMGLSQEHRVFEAEFLYQQHTAGGLTIEWAHDLGAYGATGSDKVWTEAAVDSHQRVSFRPKPRGSSVRFRVRDTEPAVVGSGRGFTFIGISADVAPIQGATRGTPRIATSLRR